jgi:hypothetical protein
MGLPDYFARNAVAASQVLAGFDEERLAAVLQNVCVGVTIGADAEDSPEGRALADLVTRIVARLYPTISVRCETRPELADAAMELALRLNPRIDFSEHPTVEIIIGRARATPGVRQVIFAGSNGWKSMISTSSSRTIGETENPFGAGVAACLAAANVFRFIFLRQRKLDTDVTFSALSGGGDSANARLYGSLGEVVLVGAGAIGNAAGWALSRLPMTGLVHIVDHEDVDLGNLQRYVLAERVDEHGEKSTILARYFTNGVRAEPHHKALGAFVAQFGYRSQRMLLGLDSARDRRASQASLPQWIANAWTQAGDLGVSTHDFLDGACVSCLYLPEKNLENEDAIIANSFGIPERLMQIRVLLHRGDGVTRDLLEAIAAAHEIALERLLPFEGQPVRTLYVEGFCGGAVLPLERIGRPRQDVHVPIAHQSALAGVLLAASAAQDALGLTPVGTQVTRLDILRPVPSHTRQPAAKDPRGICICQDRDYLNAYRMKYVGERSAG